MGLRLSVAKSWVCHIDEGFDFLGWRIQRRAWRSRTGKKAVYTYPSKKTLASILDKVRTLTRRAKHRTLADLLRRLNPTLRGWCNYFRHGVSARTFGYVDHFAFWRIVGWLRKRHVRLNMRTLIRRFLPGWKIRAGNVEMFRPKEVAIVRYRYRGTHPDTMVEPNHNSGMTTWRAGCSGTGTSGSGMGRRNGPVERPAPRCGPTSHPDPHRDRPVVSGHRAGPVLPPAARLRHEPSARRRSDRGLAADGCRHPRRPRQRGDLPQR